jgi:integrase
VIRRCPIGPALAELLEQRERWFKARFERDSAPTDPLCVYTPYGTGGWPTQRWSERTALRWWRLDLEFLGVPHPSCGPRRVHATRHSWASIAINAGASAWAAEAITHASSRGRRGSSFFDYAHLSWASLCDVVSRIVIDPAARAECAQIEPEAEQLHWRARTHRREEQR